MLWADPHRFEVTAKITRGGVQAYGTRFVHFPASGAAASPLAPERTSPIMSSQYGDVRHHWYLKGKTESVGPVFGGMVVKLFVTGVEYISKTTAKPWGNLEQCHLVFERKTEGAGKGKGKGKV